MSNVNKIVAIDGIGNINNFKHLPVFFDNVVVHHDPQIDITNGEAITNFDLLITTEKCEAINERFQVVLRRYPKSVQNVSINEAIMHPPLSHFKPLRCWKKDDSNQNWRFGSNIPQQVVLKSEHGARGQGQFLIDIKETSIPELIREIETVGSGRNQEEVDQFFENHPTLKSGSNDGDCFEQFMILKDQPLFLQEFTSVKREYRVLFFRRDRNADRKDSHYHVFDRQLTTGNGFQQARGYFSAPPLSLVSIMSEEVIEEFHAIVDRLGLVFGSIDLFQRNDGTWGVFEYCNQFGTIGDPNFMGWFHMAAVKSWLD